MSCSTGQTKAPPLKLAPPGRMMMTVPIKPMATNTQRNALTGWRSHNAATKVIASGVIATTAVNSASGK